MTNSALEVQKGTTSDVPAGEDEEGDEEKDDDDEDDEEEKEDNEEEENDEEGEEEEVPVPGQPLALALDLDLSTVKHMIIFTMSPKGKEKAWDNVFGFRSFCTISSI